jgi:phage gp46-like protein
MTDIAIKWDNTTGYGEWVLADGGITAGPDLHSAVLCSLFSDKLAPPEYQPPDGSTDRRGHWSDTYETRPLGSWLWLLNRATFSAATNLVLQARDYCNASLQWLIDDGIAASVNVQVQRANPTTLAIFILITQPVTSATTALEYSYVWRQSGV